MKKLFTLIAAALFAVSASAEATRISLGGQGEGGSWSWGWTQAFGAEADLSFTSKWGEFNLATTGLTEGATYKLVVEEANALVQLKINGATEADNQYIAVDKTEITGTIAAGTKSIVLQATEEKQLLKVKSFEIAGTQTAYSTNWGVAMLGGSYTTSKWAELYLVGAAAFESQTITLKFATAVPEGALQLKVKYADGSDESYPQVPAGTKAEINIEKAVKEISLQATDAYSIDIIGVYSTPIGETVPDEDGGEESTSLAINYAEMKAGDFTVANATKNADESTDTKNVYDIKADEELQFTLNTAPNVVFTITNGSDKAKAFIVNVNGDDTTDKGSVEFGGKNGVVIFKDAKVGDVIKMVVAAKGSTAATIGVLPSTGNDLIESTVITLPKKAKNTEGADADGYVWKEFSFKVTEDMIKTLDGVKVVRVKETAGGYRCKAASINADLPTGIQNVKAADVKSANGAIYNLAGQKVNESYKGIVIKNGKKYIQK